ncbi:MULTISPECIES: restriction endonuclease subunit S [Escherichia]|nr:MULTISPECIES: restriction endonuclease subunit S [Escherichia]EKJ7609462.1 restriction endonuclease subunit S [Escherichia coli]MCS0924928.1 restriction endonuclease subunit S [Escherichia coli]MCS0962737.1 restriction endonuclease subunit S [Escherichia coli]MCY6974957.1 restriction endonuclease subunit S [Escherichia coli]MCY6979746.1 restriction endonuclease subunit S [Escherichia coli]
MSELTYLEKLLDGVKVEWQTLGKVLKRTKGTKITAGQMKALHKDNAPLKIFAGGKTVAFVDFKDIPEKDINREPSIIVKSRGIIEFEYYDKPFSHKNEMWSYHSNNDAISIKYIYYFLKINEGYFQKIGGKMQMPQIATPDTDKFEVPIPCPDNPEKSLAIQSEIVRILDKFTALTAELTAELNMRKKQYNYYRDQLLSFDEEQEKPVYLEKLLDGVKVEWKTLEKVLKRTKGTKITAGQMKDLHKDNAPLKIFAGGKTVAFVDFKDIPEKDINREPSIIVKSRGIIEFEYYDKPFSHKNEMWSYHSNNDAISIKYIYYFLKINEGYFQKIGGKMQMPQIATPDTDKFEVPIPCPDNPEKSLAIQSEIVRILDKFDTLTNSITEGLPREIELRQKQYEYYRDLLFSFPKPETVSN